MNSHSDSFVPFLSDTALATVVAWLFWFAALEARFRPVEVSLISVFTLTLLAVRVYGAVEDSVFKYRRRVAGDLLNKGALTIEPSSDGAVIVKLDKTVLATVKPPMVGGE